MGALNLTDLPYHALEENSRPPTPDLYHHTLRLDDQMNFRPRQDLCYHNIPVNRINNTLQHSSITRNRETARPTHSSTELMCKLTVNFFGLNPHSIPISTHIKYRTFPSPFVVTSLQFTSTDEPPIDHQCGTIIFYNPVLGLKYKTTFWNLWFDSLWNLCFYSL